MFGSPFAPSSASESTRQTSAGSGGGADDTLDEDISGYRRMSTEYPSSISMFAAAVDPPRSRSSATAAEKIPEEDAQLPSELSHSPNADQEKEYTAEAAAPEDAASIPMAATASDDNLDDGPETWTALQVSIWARKAGFEIYQRCFRDNYINGPRLLQCDSATLTRLGIRDFNDNRKIAAAIRHLLDTRQPKFSDSVADYPWSPNRVLPGCTPGYGQAPFPDPKP